MIRFSYQLNDFRHWIIDLGKLLGLPTKGGKMEFTGRLGQGYILTAHHPAGFSYAVMDFTPNEALTFFHRHSSPPALYLLFKSAPFLLSTTTDREMVIPQNTPVRCICIYYPAPFLDRYVRKDVLDSLFRYLDDAPDPSDQEPVPFEFRPVLEDIFTTDTDSPLRHLTLHNRIQLLTEHFLHGFLTKAAFSLPGERFWVKSKQKDLEALKSIVRILSDTQTGKFPSIDTLSKTAMMSSTKLKSRFKQMYGMKLYEFYNRNRLEQAREMLKTGNYSVKQVGVNIGFTNLSNFAKAFRKEFGVLPKDLLRK
jgi:AraC-like DNA-binding protein